MSAFEPTLGEPVSIAAIDPAGQVHGNNAGVTVIGEPLDDGLVSGAIEKHLVDVDAGGLGERRDFAVSSGFVIHDLAFRADFIFLRALFTVIRRY